MKNLKCSNCGLVNRIDAPACLRCKRTFDENDSPTSGVTTVPISNTFSISTAEEDKEPWLKSFWATVLVYRYLIALGLGVVLITSLLNQTQFVSKWFVQKEIAQILQNLDERTNKEPSPKLMAARDRVQTLAVDGSRGRQKAIKELVHLDPAILLIKVPNPGTRKKQLLEDIALAWAPMRMFNGVPLSPREAENARLVNYDPAQKGSYKEREALIGEYVCDILANIGEPAIEPIMERIKTIHAAQQAGDTTMAAYMPRELLVALGRIKSPLALDLLIECATSKTYGLNNIGAIEALSFYDSADPRLLGIYDMALNEARKPTDQNKPFIGPYVIRVASDGLVRINSPASLQILISHLDYGYWEFGPTIVVKAITRFGKSASHAVLELVNDSTATLRARQGAILALGLLKASEARPELITLLDSPDFHIPAARALIQWNKVDTIPDLEAAKKRHPEWDKEFEAAIREINF